MTSKTWSRKFVAVVAAVAVLSVYSMVVLATPGAKASGVLSVSGQVTVNGQRVIGVEWQPGTAPDSNPRAPIAWPSLVRQSVRAKAWI